MAASEVYAPIEPDGYMAGKRIFFSYLCVAIALTGPAA